MIAVEAGMATVTRRKIVGLTDDQSAPVHDWVEFLHEALDAREAILEWRRGSGPAPVPWPAWCLAVHPQGVGPDLCRWPWEEISSKGKRLCNLACREINRLGSSSDEECRHPNEADYFESLIFGYSKAYRLVRYAWVLSDDKFNAQMDDWAVRTRAHLARLPVEPIV